MDELQLDLIASSAKSQGQLDVPGVLLGLNADDAHAAGQKALQVHEHFRPVKAAHRNNAINESGAVVDVGNAFLLEVPLQFPALRLVLGTLLAYLFRACKDLGGCFADGINVPSQRKKNGRGNEGRKAR